MSGRRGLLLGGALALPGAAALAQGAGLQPHVLYSSTRDQADLATMRRLLGCGIQVAAEDSNFYEGLAPDFYVVISDPLPSRAAAEAQLARAKDCGVTGQLRMARRRVAPH
ncbi:hypothetical protein [Sediminicoccus sp. BL-A-41-H5]|uniref:hypothetical protein n=1 Tax=Sediminicoccus sp. BL-A-41-H5 TaxID=3421106 RepID=UPI003D66849D